MITHPAEPSDVQFMRAMNAENTSHWQLVDEIFNAVIEAPPRDRAARLDALCGSNAGVRADVSRLLASDGRVEPSFLQPAVVVRPPSSEPLGTSRSIRAEQLSAQRWVGRRIGEFTLARCIAVGGMGAVYEAVQDHPRRAVALKFMQGSIASPQRLRRFITEAEILAQLQHPNIAQVFEAGAGDDGPDSAPYMAMELIPEATTITEFVRQRNLDPTARLDLFLQVCDAVQYVHQRGVIHRDLKPGNILVDAAGRPRVIDFGVARLAEGDSAAATRLTEARQLVGTLPYMSPEQLRGDAAQVDTRSDVYALGVVLFEILTGQLPIAARAESLPDAIRAIESAAPLRPSSLDRSLRGDLETIVLKALEKRPERRYPSVEALSEDIRRFRDGRPINARAPTLRYQLARLVRRHKAAATLAAFLAAACVIFGLAMTRLYLHAEESRRAAEQSRQRAEAAQRKEQAATARARQALASLQSVLRGLTSADGQASTEVPGADGALTPLEILDRSTRAIRESFRDDPLESSNLLLSAAQLYGFYGHYTRSALLAEEALSLRRAAPEFDAAVECSLQRQVANYWCLAAQIPRAAEWIDRALAAAEKSLAGDEPAVIEAIAARSEIDRLRGNFGAAAAGLDDAIGRAQRSARFDPAQLADFHVRLALVADRTGDRRKALVSADLAVALYQDSVGAEDYRTASTRALIQRLSLSPGQREAPESFVGLMARGRCNEAEQFVLEQLDNQRKQYGADSPLVHATTHALADVRQLRGDLNGATELLRSAIGVSRRLFGQERLDVLCGDLLDLAEILWVRGELAAADELYEDARALHRRSVDAAPDDMLRVGAPMLLGFIEVQRGQPARGEELLRECLQTRAKLFSDDHFLVGYARGILALAVLRQGRFDEAEELAMRAYRTCMDTQGPYKVNTHNIIRILAELSERRGDDEHAAEWRSKLHVCSN